MSTNNPVLFIWPDVANKLLPEWLLWVADGAVLLCALLVFLWIFRIAARYLKRRRTYTRMRAMLRRVDLSDAEHNVLQTLAGGGFHALYRMLETPVIFENRVHRAHHRGMDGLAFIGRLRASLGYTSKTPNATIVSTRQLSEGDLCQILVHDRGIMHEFYGVISAVSTDDLVLRLNQSSLKMIMNSKEHDTQFGVLLGEGRAIHQFPFHPIGQDVAGQGLRVAHSMLDTKHASRNPRLPMLRNVKCRVRHPGKKEVVREALLIEVSEGGCSMMFDQRLPVQAAVSFWLPIRWSTPISMVGFVLESYEQSRGWWIARLSVSRMSKPQRETMREALKREFQRRLNRLEKDLTQ